MKKGVALLSIFLLAFYISMVFASAQTTECEEGDEQCLIDEGYACLNDQIDKKTCDKLSSDERIFSLLATGDCETEVTDDSKYLSNIKFTAQAILGQGGDNEAEEWLLDDRTRTASNLNWFLQIESGNATECRIDYDGTDHVIEINENKIINSNAGSCLTLAQGGIWLQVDDSCYEENYTISCDRSFITSLLYQKDETGAPYFISEETHSASADGETEETVNSLCFGSGSCDYEGSLWSALVLESLGHDVSPYIPYLVTLAEDTSNKKYLPEAFLFPLTGQFKSELTGKQKGDKYWDESGDRYYDTSLALYALQYESVPQKENSREWFFSTQGENGCWDNTNIENTAFVLYSLEPRASTIVPSGGVDCEDAGYFCSSGITCDEAQGDVLPGYSCSGTFICCSEEKTFESCSVQGGEVCSSIQVCSGGTEVDSSDASFGESCCIGGTCELKTETPEQSACEEIGGNCRISGCFEGETESPQSCDFSSDICCVQEQRTGLGMIWIIILFLLIVLIVVGIIYKDKLRHLWFRFKSRFIGGGTQATTHHPGPPRFPPMQRMIPRSIMPSSHPQHHPPSTHMKSKQPGELKDVLKKLREIGK